MGAGLCSSLIKHDVIRLTWDGKERLFMVDVGHLLPLIRQRKWEVMNLTYSIRHLKVKRICPRLLNVLPAALTDRLLCLCLFKHTLSIFFMNFSIE
jgi:hypothetical protein